jgi:large subunit ribosomal protein L17
MKHKHSNRILSRSASNRHALLQQLTSALLTHGHIVTTEAKAKELRRHIEPLITEAKQELTLHRRRQLLRKLAHHEELPQLVAVAGVHKNRPGGYLRAAKLPHRKSDNASLCRVDIIDFPV